MNGYPVLKGASYTLAITPDMVIHNGTTQTTEMIVNPESEYLKELPNHLRSFEDAVSYIPNQVYIGNAKPADLAATEFPFYDKSGRTLPAMVSMARSCRRTSSTALSRSATYLS